MQNSVKNNRIKRIIVWITIVVFCAFMAVLEWIPIPFVKDVWRNAIYNKILQQACGLTAAIVFLCFLRIRLFGKIHNWLYLLPCIVVAVNNFQWWSYFSGYQQLVRQNVADITLFATYCLLVGLFEEFVFRGILFSALASVFPKNKKGLLTTFVFSSCIFGLTHLLNGNVLQALYSILTGGLFAFVLIKTQNLLCCGVIHGLYNFCGLLMDKASNLGLGNGVKLFNWGTILTMGSVVVLMIVFVVYSLIKHAETERKTLYQRLSVKDDDNIGEN
ncbi:MAG: CPBP family intramembrane metalloprotease [Clostridiales bacterium]|nr:CPBP family intramembrane metalloprotease [Clostridiales bacterium]